MLLDEFFLSIEDEVIGMIRERMMNYFDERIKAKKPLNVSQQTF